MKRIYEKNRSVELRLLYTGKRIAAEVGRLAHEISSDYAGRELLLVVVLKGAFIFAADLARRIRLPLTVDFVKLASYNGMESTGKVVITKDIETAAAGKHVLVVEDIVDTGLSLAFLLESLRSRGPKSLKVCTLIDKRERRRVDVSADYVGIVCDRGFLVGYGLDLDESRRELPAIYEVVNSPSGGLNDSPM
ncbi:MAG: hypoxanthine [Geobacteraceae bacterium]|nr:MAG: hypoxanthine [Geobacteraceae bacterium]